MSVLPESQFSLRPSNLARQVRPRCWCVGLMALLPKVDRDVPRAVSKTPVRSSPTVLPRGRATLLRFAGRVFG